MQDNLELIKGIPALCFLIYAMSQSISKFFSLLVFGIYGMVISGTRGALAVPIVGFMTYFVLSKT
jgi:hypothetical protein